MTAEISCPGCGHYAHRKHACKGGMGDYCDCGHDKEEANTAPMRDAIKHGPPPELAGMDE